MPHFHFDQMQMSPFAWKEGALLVWATLISNETKEATATTHKELKHVPAIEANIITPYTALRRKCLIKHK
jgi:hypothetical protein